MVEFTDNTPKENCPVPKKVICCCRITNPNCKKKLKYVQPPIMPSFAPVKLYKPPEVKMTDNSTYKMSYEAFDPKMLRSCRPPQSIAKENLVSVGEFSGNTTHKMSYGSWIGIEKEKIIYPHDHKLGGDGPMSNMTTARHDYQAKKMQTNSNIIQKTNLGLSCAKMETQTVNALSYQCPNFASLEAPISYKPIMRYLPPSCPIDSNTIHKSSFLPWEARPKEEFPWAKRGPYTKPEVPIECNTIYNGSFIAPGSVVEDEDGHCEGCNRLYPGEIKEVHKCQETY